MGRLETNFQTRDLNNPPCFPELLDQYCQSIIQVALWDEFINGPGPTYEFIQEQVGRLREIGVSDYLKMMAVESIAVRLHVRDQCLHEFPAPQTTCDVRLAARPTGETLFTDVGNWANILDIVLNKAWERWDRLRKVSAPDEAPHLAH